jgi:hypothetical protein
MRNTIDHHRSACTSAWPIPLQSKTLKHHAGIAISEPLSSGCEVEVIFFANVPDHLLPLAFGADPAAAGSVTKVPKAW